MNMNRHNPAAPFELLTGWLDDLAATVTTFAAQVGISRVMSSRVLHGHAAEGADMCSRRLRFDPGGQKSLPHLGKVQTPTGVRMQMPRIGSVQICALGKFGVGAHRLWPKSMRRTLEVFRPYFTGLLARSTGLRGRTLVPCARRFNLIKRERRYDDPITLGSPAYGSGVQFHDGFGSGPDQSRHT